MWTSCDLASGGNTVILNANSPIEPIVQHRFEYKGEDVVDGTVTVESEVQSDDLDAILSRNGFSRRDVINARVDSVEIINPAPSLREADVFLGTDAEGPLIAQIVSFPDDVPSVVDDTSTPVLEAVRNDEVRTLYGRFGLESAGDGAVQAKVYYRLKVEGV